MSERTLESLLELCSKKMPGELLCVSQTEMLLLAGNVMYLVNNTDTALKYDGEKVRLDLLPTIPLVEIGKVLQFGAKKYSAHNWRKGMDWSRPYAATMRHMLAWNDGETFDPETKLNHLAHAACEIFFLLDYAYHHPSLDDRWQVYPHDTNK